MKKWKLIALCTALVLGLPLFCMIFNHLQHGGGSSVVFIEHKNHTRGQLVSGNYTPAMLSGEAYSFEVETRQLTSSELSGGTGSLKALLGTTRSRMQDAGTGLASQLTCITSLPTNAGGLTIDNVFDNGTVVLLYNSKRISLKSGERWENIWSSREETGNYRIDLVCSDTIRNYGNVKITSPR